METIPFAFERLYCDYSIAVKRCIASYIKDGTVAEDIFQDIFLKVWEKLPSYDRSRGGVYSWLSSIAVSKCIDHLRKKKRSFASNDDNFSRQKAIEPRAQSDTLLIRRELDNLCARLPEPHYAILALVYFKGYTQEETAIILNLPLGTVKTRQRRALQLMRNAYL